MLSLQILCLFEQCGNESNRPDKHAVPQSHGENFGPKLLLLCSTVTRGAAKTSANDDKIQFHDWMPFKMSARVQRSDLTNTGPM